MFGNVRFPAIAAEGKYVLSIGPHGFYWFQLERAAAPARTDMTLPDPHVSSARWRADGRPLIRSRAGMAPAGAVAETAVVCREGKVARAASVVDRIMIRDPLHSETQGEETSRAIFLVSMEFSEGEADLYAVPITMRRAEEGADAPGATPGIFMYVRDASNHRWTVQDGMTDPAFARLLLQMAMEGGAAAGQTLRLSGRTTGNTAPASDLASLEAKIPDSEQSNSNVLFDQQLLFKLYRRIGDGTNPELEIGEHLTKVGFTNTAPVAGTIEILGRGAAAHARSHCRVRRQPGGRLGGLSRPRASVL